MRCAR